MQTFLLFLHVLGAAVWIGGAVTALVLQRQFGPEGEAAVAWRERSAVLGRALYPPAAVLVLITGVLMVTGDEAYSFADTFVSLGFLAFIVGLVLGVGVYGPQGSKALEALKQGNLAAALAIDRRLMLLGLLELALLVVTLLAMVYRWGS
jgi:uncharacterized membrane protein